MLLLLLGWLNAFAGTLTVSFLDVGQGDSILLQSPDGRTALIDAGPRGSPVTDQLRSLGVENLNLVIATHGHADHIGGMLDVLEAFPTNLYVDQGMPHTSATYENLMTHLERSGQAYRTARAGQSFSLGEEVLIEVLHPHDVLLTNTRSDLNSNSVVARVTHDEICILLVGDAEEDTEMDLLRRGLEPCQVLKVAHHGSAYSTTAAWVRTVEPEVAIISSGEGNRYGHPAPDTLARLTSGGAEIFRTDLHGTIQLYSDGSTVTVETNRVPLAATTSTSTSTSTGTRNSPTLDNPIDVNSATARELETLPGIGEVKAAAIVDWRESHGPFASLSDLDAVPGIGPGTLARIEHSIIFGPAAESGDAEHE